MRPPKFIRFGQYIAAASLLAIGLTAAIGGPAAQAAEKSLYERLGGMTAIEAVVEDFSARQLADTRLSKYYVNTDKPVWKKHLSSLICNAAGGPCKYTGRPMNRAHARLNLSEDKFNWTAAHLVASLNKFNVPKREQDELVAVVVSLKDQIVGQ